MGLKKPEQKIEKVAPYPIAAQVVFAEGRPPIPGKILKLTDTGFLLQLITDFHFKVGDNHKVQFQIPVLGTALEEEVKVIKTYDSIDDVKNKTLHKHFRVEMHFRALSEKKREEILKFCQRIGQK